MRPDPFARAGVRLAGDGLRLTPLGEGGSGLAGPLLILGMWMLVTEMRPRHHQRQNADGEESLRALRPTSAVLVVTGGPCIVLDAVIASKGGTDDERRDGEHRGEHREQDRRLPPGA